MFNSFTYKSSSTLLRSLFITLFLLSTSYAKATAEPQLLMENTAKKMLKEFITHSEAIRKDHAIAYKLINENLVPRINFLLMSRWVLGKNWKKASTAQQQEFVTEFQKLVVKFYSRALLQYMEKNELKEDIITFKQFRGKPNSKYATVRSQVNPPNGGEPIKVNYDLYQSKNKQWQVYDVTVEGVSLITTYRSSFKQIISKNGMNALLDEIKDKNSELNKTDNMPSLISTKEK